MADVPGTVSRILWHFTGGPAWNPAENRQNKTPKSADAAYAALVGILESRTLKRGSYQEVVKVKIPEVRRYNRTSKRFKTYKNVLTNLQSASVCCLADIPVVHLSYQANRYGKFAIGFHREAAIKHGFNPVFYTLHETKVMRSIAAIEEFLAFVKTFGRNEFGTIYCEREWRSTRSFKFDYSDVA